MVLSKSIWKSLSICASGWQERITLNMISQMKERGVYMYVSMCHILVKKHIKVDIVPSSFCSPLLLTPSSGLELLITCKWARGKTVPFD